MTSEQVERVAQAFYEAEYPTEWFDAPGILQEQHRELARSAITFLNHQIADHHAGAVPVLTDSRDTTAISDARNLEQASRELAS
ncbi:hypothetical protein BB934_34515 (plasmid) [Microvirga ossetica]|uniref:Uncharacterized protein n=1 Tax=Microvirga ossetica TaxID=1882682 RepID=A0A1B2ETT1_9HYPH|nr:hypothetical protein [Microvirga ossetica]ANY83404.1 hypothetical protein BB934_34515 [Microvirga ossetica]